MKILFEFILDYIVVNAISILFSVLIGGFIGVIFSLQKMDIFDYEYLFFCIVWFGLIIGFYYIETKNRSIQYKAILLFFVSIMPLILDYKGAYDFIIFAIFYTTPIFIAHIIYKFLKTKQRTR